MSGTIHSDYTRADNDTGLSLPIVVDGGYIWGL